MSGPPAGYTGPPAYYGPPPGFGPPPPAPARMNPMAIVAVFTGILLALALVAAVVVLLNQPLPPDPQCEPGQPCTGPPASLPPIAGATPAPGTAAPATARPTAPGSTAVPTGGPATPAPIATPTSDSPPVVAGALWRDDALGYSFEYRDTVFTLAQSEEGLAVLNGAVFDAQIVIQAVPASTSPAQLIADQLARVDRFLIGRVPDNDSYDALLGPSIGYVRGEGGVYSGTLVSQDGTPLAPGGVTILASTDGRLTVAVLVIVGTPDLLLGSDTHQHAVRSAADDILKTFDWDTR